MRTALAGLALTIVVAQAACFEPVAEDRWHRHRDASMPARDGGSGTDASSSRSDAAVFGADAGECRGTWSSQVRSIEKIELLDGVSRYGATDRLKVTIQTKGACERPGRVDVQVIPGNATDFVELTAHSWVRDQACASEPMTSLIEIPGRQHGNVNVAVSDSQNLAGPAGIGYQRGACSGVPECQCSPNQPPGTVPWGGTCKTDCNCQSGLSCIGGYGVAGEYWSCQRSCIDGTSCPVQQTCPVQAPDSLPNVCAPLGSCAGTDCSAGFTCQGGGCVDQRQPGMSETCSCDADCHAGQHCTVSTRPTPTCEVWCADNRQCPGGDLSWFVCGTPSVCVPLD